MRITVETERPEFVSRARSYRLEGRPHGLFLAAHPLSDYVDLPLEIVPRVAALRLAELLLEREPVLDFVNGLGPLGVHDQGFRALRRVHKDYVLGEFLQRQGLPKDWMTNRSLAGHRYTDADRAHGEYLHEFYLGVAHLQALLACYTEVRGQRFSAKRLLDKWPPLPWAQLLSPPEDKGEARVFLVLGINSGLYGITPWLVPKNALSSWDITPLLKRDEALVTHLTEPLTLYGICCLELLENLDKELPYRLCANETCSKLFSRHEGRTQYGGHRPDAIFCRPECAQAQAQREYRRRLKQRSRKER